MAVWLATVLGAHAADGVVQTAQIGDAHASNADSKFSQAADLVLRALAYIGVRYEYGGDSSSTGFDCSGLVYRVFKQAAGLILPHDALEISRIGQRIKRAELKPGDLVFFNTRRQPFSHVGIYLGEKRFIHAPSRGGRVEVVNMTEAYWERRYDGARRIAIDQSY